MKKAKKNNSGMETHPHIVLHISIKRSDLWDKLFTF
jgi:hypothetical protein